MILNAILHLYRIISLSYSIPSEHKVATRLCHPVLSLTFVSASPQVMPSSFSSYSIVLRQVVFGMPLGLFPWVVHLRAILVILDTGILRTYPSHLKRLCCISLRTHVEFVISSIMRRIKERHTIQWPREKGQTMIYKNTIQIHIFYCQS